MKNDPMSMLPVLPCGVPFDATKGECCASNCKEDSIRAERDPKTRSRAIEACRYWANGQVKTTGASQKPAASKSRKK